MILMIFVQFIATSTLHYETQRHIISCLSVFCFEPNYFELSHLNASFSTQTAACLFSYEWTQVLWTTHYLRVIALSLWATPFFCCRHGNDGSPVPVPRIGVFLMYFFYCCPGKKRKSIVLWKFAFEKCANLFWGRNNNLFSKKVLRDRHSLVDVWFWTACVMRVEAGSALQWTCHP